MKSSIKPPSSLKITKEAWAMAREARDREEREAYLRIMQGGSPNPAPNPPPEEPAPDLNALFDEVLNEELAKAQIQNPTVSFDNEPPAAFTTPPARTGATQRVVTAAPLALPIGGSATRSGPVERLSGDSGIGKGE